MKTLLTLIFSLAVITAVAQGKNYEAAMTAALEKMKSSETVANFQQAANTFERISITETKEWLPLYYASYSMIVISYFDQDVNKKDAYLDKAQQFLDKAFKIAPDESELYSLQAFLYPSRITVDPMGRGMEYMPKMNAAIDKAIALNPENPRSYYLRAITLFNMPEQFGGGADAARPHFETAKEKFDRFEPKSPLHPNWGKEINEMEMQKL
ncbi:tetratricopeptide repeat protein [Draconibacterium halophilum]|uniref:Tetratricopeptide repeat protein n=1 Tax=Draconibacterium halophilum TaxID=2706887 RepID=A0A6C0RE35_9BACT|nr:hypothetical protein [Draconibacterium halophilum]QIA08142.1 hypothetical protein G0Q07_10610 [Draconibacterium halophilum]